MTPAAIMHPYSPVAASYPLEFECNGVVVQCRDSYSTDTILGVKILV